MFAYRQIRKCPKCGHMYDMKFPAGTGSIPVIVALFICVLLTLNVEYDLLVSAAIFILVYYFLDIGMKILFIHTNYYTIEELER